MGSRLSAPGPQERRFAAYIEGLARAAGHEDRHAPLKDYCKGLLLPGERKSIEPMAARLNPSNVQATRQSLHHQERTKNAFTLSARNSVTSVTRRRKRASTALVEQSPSPI